MDWLPKDAHAAGLVGSYDAAVVTKDASGKVLGDFIDPGQAGLVIVGESKVEDAIKHAVTRAEKQTAKELDMDLKDVDKALQEGKPCKKLSRRCSPASADAA